MRPLVMCWIPYHTDCVSSRLLSLLSSRRSSVETLKRSVCSYTSLKTSMLWWGQTDTSRQRFCSSGPMLIINPQLTQSARFLVWMAQPCGHLISNFFSKFFGLIQLYHPISVSVLSKLCTKQIYITPKKFLSCWRIKELETPSNNYLLHICTNQ